MINKKNFFILIYLKTHSKDTKKNQRDNFGKLFFYPLTSDYCLLPTNYCPLLILSLLFNPKSLQTKGFKPKTSLKSLLRSLMRLLKKAPIAEGFSC